MLGVAQNVFVPLDVDDLSDNLCGHKLTEKLNVYYPKENMKEGKYTKFTVLFNNDMISSIQWYTDLQQR